MNLILLKFASYSNSFERFCQKAESAIYLVELNISPTILKTDFYQRQARRKTIIFKTAMQSEGKN